VLDAMGHAADGLGVVITAAVAQKVGSGGPEAVGIMERLPSSGELMIATRGRTGPPKAHDKQPQHGDGNSRRTNDFCWPADRSYPSSCTVPMLAATWPHLATVAFCANAVNSSLQPSLYC
jgi:hypothetical protein